MADGSKRFWMIRHHRGAIEVPILDPCTVLVFWEAGWEVQDLPLADLSENDLRCLSAAQGDCPPGHER